MISLRRERIKVRVAYEPLPSPFPLPEAGEGNLWFMTDRSSKNDHHHDFPHNVLAMSATDSGVGTV